MHQCLRTLLPVIGTGCRTGREPRARQGVLDLTDVDLDQGDPVRLDGERAFHWGKLLVSDDSHEPRKPAPVGFLTLH